MVGSLCQTKLTLCKLSRARLRERRGFVRALGVLWAGKWPKPGGYQVPSKPSRGGTWAGGPELCSCWRKRSEGVFNTLGSSHREGGRMIQGSRPCQGKVGYLGPEAASGIRTSGDKTVAGLPLASLGKVSQSSQ